MLRKNRRLDKTLAIATFLEDLLFFVERAIYSEKSQRQHVAQKMQMCTM